MLKLASFLPHILNLQGDFANAKAMQKIAEAHGISCQLDIIDTTDLANFRFTNYDMVFMASGEVEQFVYIKRQLEQHALLDDLKEFIAQGKVLLACGTTVALFAQYIELQNGEKCEGLGILPIEAKERTHIYADDVISRVQIKDRTLHLWGAQVQLVDFTQVSGAKEALSTHAKPFGELLYGYGDNGKTKTEGWQLGNAIFTLLHAPLLVYNPWLGSALIHSYCEAEINPSMKALDFSAEQECARNFCTYVVNKPQGFASYKAPDLATIDLKLEA